MFFSNDTSTTDIDTLSLHDALPICSPAVVTYDLDQIVQTLNSVIPYDWHQFFIDRVYRVAPTAPSGGFTNGGRSEEHTSELQSLRHLVCRLLLEKKNKTKKNIST